MTKNVVVQNIDRTALDIVDELSQLGSSTIHEAWARDELAFASDLCWSADWECRDREHSAL